MPASSNGVTVNDSVPAAVGVPLTVRVGVPAPVIASPGTPVMLDTPSRTGPTPPVPLTVWLYAAPACAAGSVAGVSVTPGDTETA